MGVLRLSLGRLAHAAFLVVLSGWLLRPLPLHAQFFSPGELSKSHASLEGDAHCSDCHSAGRGVSNDKCMSCHADVARTLRQKTGLHGRQYAGRACAECHVDHRGKSHELSRWEPQRFDHALTGWALSSSHQKPACASCHTGKNARGNATFIGLSRDCASCHKDPHAGRFGDRCQTCHDDVAWKNLDLDPFDHDLTRFELLGQHARTACAKCHGTPAKYQPLVFEACGDCHRDPHRGRFGAQCESCHSEDGWQKLHMERDAHPGVSLAGGHQRVACAKCHDRGNLKSPSKGERCVSCHAPVHQAAFGNDCKDCHGPIRWLGLPDELGRRVHDETRYPLSGKHASTACDSCHSPALPAARRFRELAFDDCLDCHKDSHRGQFRDRDRGACEPCHTTAGFTPTLFGQEAHATTRFELTGAHEAAPCGTCHTGSSPRLDWQLERLACAECHDNPHGSRFASEMRQGGCATCHSSVAWDVPSRGSGTGFAHDTWPLTGKHQGVRCDGCHTPSEADRRAGHGESYREAPRECEGCHADTHLGQFRLTQPQRQCASCHDTASFRLPAFDHRASTGYALLGKHAAARCAACHDMGELRDGQRTTLWRLPYDECRDCHANPHVEEQAARHLSVTEQMDCSACHTPDRWKSLTAASNGSGFDHASTGFPLTARHRDVACASCHGGERVVTRQCVGCHEDAHAGQLGAACDGCHSSASWYQTNAFARHRQTRLPLTGMHALVECRDCHQRSNDRTWTSVAADCFACHEADYRRPDLHPLHVGSAGDPNTPPFPRDCAQCHRTIAWSPAFVSNPLVTGGLATAGAALRSGEHDRVFPLSFGPHRGAECSSCHTSPGLPQAVRCNGCHAHDETRLRQQHQKVAAFQPNCLVCHPGGRAR